MKYNKLSVLLAGACFLSACMMGPNYKKPELDLSTNYSSDDFSIFTSVKWWEVFESPALNLLEEEALEHNKDLQAAMAAVDVARAQAGVATADQMPAIGAYGETGRAGDNKGSGETLSTANLSATFELDLWGKYRRLSEAARANLLASQAAKDVVRLTLSADVAANYIALVTLDEQLVLTRRTLQTRKENYRIYQSRYKNGYITEIDLKRIEADMAGVEAQEAELEKQLAKTESALAVLAGRSPRQIVENTVTRDKTLNELVLVPDIPEGIPSDLLARRPDVRQAEGMLIASNARIGAARAAFFPSIPLTGSAGYSSSALSDLFQGPSGVWAIGGSIAAPIFQGGKLIWAEKEAKASYQQMLATYEKTVQVAFKEVLDSLSDNRLTRKVFDARLKQTQALKRSYELTQKKERAGEIDTTELLDVERNLLESEMALASARQEELNAIINISKALGGGWNTDGGFGPYEKMAEKDKKELEKTLSQNNSKTK